MSDPKQIDPGWRPALALLGRIVSGRPPSGPILLVMRASVVFLSLGAGVAGLLVLVLGGGSGSARIDPIGAQILFFGAVGTAALVIALRGRDHPDDRAPGMFALWAFRTTMHQVLAAAAIGPLGLLLAWFAADAAWVIYGTGVAILLMAVVSPTERKIQGWQDDLGEEIDAVSALMAPYR